MKVSIIHTLLSLLFMLMAVLHLLSGSASHDKYFIVACVLFCSGCILEATEEKR
jgi:hypothetical protein